MPLFQLLQGYTDPVYILQISPLVIGVWLNGHEIISHGPDFGQYTVYPYFEIRTA